MYKIISRRKSFLERSITFSVDGKIETISAPATQATFDDLILRIEQKYGANKPEAETETTEKPPKESSEKSQTKKGRKSSTKTEKASE